MLRSTSEDLPKYSWGLFPTNKSCWYLDLQLLGATGHVLLWRAVVIASVLLKRRDVILHFLSGAKRRTVHVVLVQDQ